MLLSSLFVTLEKLLSILRVIYIIQKCITFEESEFFIGVQTRFLVYFLNFLLIQAFSSSFSKVFCVCKVTLIYDQVNCATGQCLMEVPLYMSLYSFKRILNEYYFFLEATVAQWLRCCATNRKVAVSIPAGVIGIFRSHKILLIALMTLGLTRPLAEMNTRSISLG
jgi:hypothetical protein